MEMQNTSDKNGKKKRVRIIIDERSRETFRLIRDIGLGVIAILGSGWTVYAAWDEFEEWGIVIILSLALIIAVLLYYRRKIRSAPYLKEGPDAELEAIKMLRETRESLHYYGGVSFITASDQWKEEYVKKLRSEVTIMRFLDTLSLNEMRQFLKKVKPIGGPQPLIDRYQEWIKTHCENLVTRSQHNCFYDFKGAPIWRYGLHCIIFDRKHIVLPFASEAETTRAVFIPNCPEIANAMAHCFEWLVTNFNLTNKDAAGLAKRARIPWSAAAEQ